MKDNEQHSSSPSASSINPPISATTANDERHLPMEPLLIGASAFVIIAVAVHIVLKVKRRKNTRRNISVRSFRKGESLIDDEDDLLISQAYS
jgi:hypothetical protein